MMSMSEKYPMLARMAAIQVAKGDDAVKQEFAHMSPEAQQQVKDEISAFKKEVLSRILTDMSAIDAMLKAKFN